MYNVASSQQNVRLRATASQNLRAQRQYISDESAAYYLTTVGRPWPLATSNPSILFAWRPRAKNARDTQRTSTYYFCQICQNFQTAICDYFLEFWKDHESEYGVGTRRGPAASVLSCTGASGHLTADTRLTRLHGGHSG